MITKSVCKRIALTFAAACLSTSAVSQWQWVDQGGRRVFSDQAPPSNVQDKNILKRPGVKASTSATTSPLEVAAPSRATAASAAAAPKPSPKDTELEAKKKQVEKDEAALAKVEAEKQAKLKDDNCIRAKRAMSTLQSGERIATVNAAGEREVMNDAKRNEEIRRTQDLANESCKK